MRDRDERVAAANAEAKEAKQEVQRVLFRSSSSEALITKGEVSLKQAEEKIDKLSKKVAALEEKLKKEQESWDTHLKESMNVCSLKAKKEIATQDVNSYLFKKQARSAGSQMMKAIDQFESYGEKLSYLLAAYEDAKKRAAETRKEKDEADAEVQQKVEEQKRSCGQRRNRCSRRKLRN